MTIFKMTVRAGCALSACSRPPPPTSPLPAFPPFSPARGLSPGQVWWAFHFIFCLWTRLWEKRLPRPAAIILAPKGEAQDDGQPQRTWSREVAGTWALAPAAALPQLSMMPNEHYSWSPDHRKLLLTALAGCGRASYVSEIRWFWLKADLRVWEESERLKLSFLTASRIPFAKPDVLQYFRSSQ